VPATGGSLLVGELPSSPPQAKSICR